MYPVTTHNSSKDANTDTVLKVCHISKRYNTKKSIFSREQSFVQAVDDVSFEIKRGKTLSLVGESGSGKSTLGRCIMQFCDIDQGEIILNGNTVSKLKGETLFNFRKKVQMIFQDGFSSLNPKMTVEKILLEPIRNFKIVHGKENENKLLRELLDAVKLPVTSLTRLPYEFSGGQRQRIGIARALASNPELIVCDESVSALDVSVKAQIINLLKEIQKERGLSLLFITHDLAIVEYISEELAVMYLGKIVEYGSVRDILFNPAHPYTKNLLSAVPGHALVNAGNSYA